VSLPTTREQRAGARGAGSSHRDARFRRRVGTEASVGGSIVAVGPDRRLRAGWPVEPKRLGAEFWTVVVGSDGTVYELAVEPEPGGAITRSIRASAPDSTVVWTTAIVEP